MLNMNMCARRCHGLWSCTAVGNGNDLQVPLRRLSERLVKGGRRRDKFNATSRFFIVGGLTAFGPGALGLCPSSWTRHTLNRFTRGGRVTQQRKSREETETSGHDLKGWHGRGLIYRGVEGSRACVSQSASALTSTADIYSS